MPSNSGPADIDQDSDSVGGEQGPRTFETDEGEVPFDDLPREQQLEVMFRNIDEVVQRLRSEWEEDRLQVYFLFYSFGTVGVMFYLMYQGLTWALVGAFCIYFGTIASMLYLYEDERFFGSGDVSSSVED